MPAGKVSRRDPIEWVVLEEPDMGLHPQAVRVVMLLVLELLRRGYKVAVSTHSPLVLQFAWAMRSLQEVSASVADARKVFDLASGQTGNGLAAAALESDCGAIYLDYEEGHEHVVSHEISQLDPAAETEAEAGWGGLTRFSGELNDAIARVVSAREA